MPRLRDESHAPGAHPVSRRRWFCSVCGALTQREPGTNGRVLCHAHSGLRVDEVPPDPAESLPTMRQVMNCEACGGSGIEYPGVECWRCNGNGRYQKAAHPGEDTHPTKGQVV